MLPAFLRYMTLVIALPLNDYKRERESDLGGRVQGQEVNGVYARVAQ